MSVSSDLVQQPKVQQSSMLDSSEAALASASRQTWHGKAWKVISSAITTALYWVIEKIMLVYYWFVALMEKIASYFRPEKNKQENIPSLIPKNDLKPISPTEVIDIVAEFEGSLKELQNKDLNALAAHFTDDYAKPEKSVLEKLNAFEPLTTFQIDVKGCNDIVIDFLLKNDSSNQETTTRLETLKTAFSSLKNHKFNRVLYDVSDEILSLIQDLNKEAALGHLQNYSERDLAHILSTLRMLNEHFQTDSFIALAHEGETQQEVSDNAALICPRIISEVEKATLPVIERLNSISHAAAVKTVEGQAANIAGVTNIGNSCYMNSVLQILFSSKTLSTLIEHRHPLTLNPDNSCSSLAEIKVKNALKDLRDCYQRVANGQSQSYSLIQKAYKLRDEVFNSGIAPLLHGKTEQQDAFDMILPLLDTIGFSSKLTTVLSTPNGPDNSTKTDDMLVYPIVLPQQSTPVTIRDLIEAARNEEINDPKSPWTPRPDVKYDQYRKTAYLSGKIPDVLMIKLNRYQRDNAGNVSAKIETPVIVEDDAVDLSSFVYPDLLLNGQTARYKLCGYVNHHGSSPNGGHYTANILKGNAWQKCDDSVVSALNSTDEGASRSQAYLLVLEKVA